MTGITQGISLRLTEEELLEMDRRIGFDGMRNRSDVLRRGLHKLLDETATPGAGRKLTINISEGVAQELELIENLRGISASAAAVAGIGLVLEREIAAMKARRELGMELVDDIGQARDEDFTE